MKTSRIQTNKSMRTFIQEITGSGRKTIGYAVLVLALSFLIFTTALWEPESGSNQRADSSPVDVSTETVSRPDPFKGLDLEAHSVYVLDISTGGVLFEKNATTRWPLASITKIMSAMTALDLLPENAVVTINEDALLLEGDSGLFNDEQWSLEELLDFSLVSSSNDGVGAIASVAGAVSSGVSRGYSDNVGVFVHAMNTKARKIGLTDTEFFNPHGLDTGEESSGAYSSARDTAIMLEYALTHYPDILDQTRERSITSTSLANVTHMTDNTNEITDRIPGILASKTGFTDLAGGNLAVVFDAGINHPVAVVVLGSSYHGRFNDMLQLVNASTLSTSDLVPLPEPVDPTVKNNVPK